MDLRIPVFSKLVLGWCVACFLCKEAGVTAAVTNDIVEVVRMLGGVVDLERSFK